MSPLLLLDKTPPLRMMHVEQFDCMKTSLSQISGRVSVVYEGKDAIREKTGFGLAAWPWYGSHSNIISCTIWRISGL